jgi:aspartate/glutamate racemase
MLISSQFQMHLKERLAQPIYRSTDFDKRKSHLNRIAQVASNASAEKLIAQCNTAVRSFNLYTHCGVIAYRSSL